LRSVGIDAVAMQQVGRVPANAFCHPDGLGRGSPGQRGDAPGV
jgi:hypothetical protein